MRSHVTAGAAVLTATAIAITPIAVTPQLPEITVTGSAVALSATVSPITRWLEVFNTSEVNFAGLANSWLEAPSPVLQQVIANQLGYLSELPNIDVIVEQMVANAAAALAAPFATDLGTLDELKQTVYDLLVNGVPPYLPAFLPPDLLPLVNFSTTYLSGALLGLAGLAINPALALGGSLHTVAESLFGDTPDLATAVNTLINMPADMVDAFLNGGQRINITSLLIAIGGELPLPMEAEIVFGGLLSAGASAFDAIEIIFDDGSVLPGNGPGLIGSLIAVSQVIAKALGWDGIGNPLAPAVTPAQSGLSEAADTSLLVSPTVTVDLPAQIAAGDSASGDVVASAVSGKSAPEPTPAVPAADDDTTDEGTEPEPDTETETDPGTVVDVDGDLGEDEGADAPDTVEDSTDADDDATAGNGSDDATDTDPDSADDSDADSDSEGSSDAGSDDNSDTSGDSTSSSSDDQS